MTPQETTPLYFDAPISQYDGISAYPLPQTPTVLQALEYIQGTTLKRQIESLRKLHIENYDAYKKEKTKLVGVTFAGTFSHRNNSSLVQPSGFASIDIDHLETADATSRLKTQLAQDKYIAAAFISPSGIGIKALIKIHPVTSDKAYKAQFRHINHYLQTTYHVKVDSLPDISRLCFMSYDPEIVINQDAQIFDVIYQEPQKKKASPAYSKSSSDVSFQAAIKTLLQTGIQEPLDRNTFVGLCAVCKHTGVSYEVFDKIMQKTEGYNATDNFKIWNTVKEDEDRDQKMTIGTIIKYARDANKTLWASFRKRLKAQDDLEGDEVYGRATQIKTTMLSRYQLSLNELTDKIMVTHNGHRIPINDCIEAEIRCFLLNKGFRERAAVDDVIKATAWRKRFNPIQEYFKSLRWDGVDYFEKLGNYVKDADGLFVPVFAAWCIGAVRRAFTGKHHPMPVWVGKQGLGKSVFIEWLCPIPDYYIQSPISPDTNDARIRVCERFIWEVAELGSTTRRQDIEALKWFISLENVAYRRSHDKYDMTKPALASLIGTVNKDGAGFLNDPTGYRRWRPVDITQIDYAYEDIDKHQIWAEAYQFFKEDPDHAHNLHQTFQERIEEKIETEYATSEPLEEIILQHFQLTGDEFDIASSVQILKACELEGYRGKGTRADSMHLARILGKECFFNRGVKKYRTPHFRGYQGIKLPEPPSRFS